MYLKNVYHHCLCCIFDQVTMPVKQKFCKSLGATLHFALLVSGWGDQEVDSFPPPPLSPPPPTTQTTMKRCVTCSPVTRRYRCASSENGLRIPPFCRQIFRVTQKCSSFTFQKGFRFQPFILSEIA